MERGDTVVDIGAGTGYFSLPLAQAVGPEGKIYAVDDQVEMLYHLLNKLHGSNILNVELVHAEADATGLPDACCALVFMANVWHEFADRSAVLRESSRILNRAGRISLLDWRPDVEREGGPPLEHRLSPADALSELHLAGFVQATQSNIGKYSWLVQAEKPR